MWLGARGVPASVLGLGGEDAPAPAARLSSLCTLPGMAKQLPLVVHAHGNSLYEEPCLQWLSLRIREARAPHTPVPFVDSLTASPAN